jgi:hypothetical protein
VYRFEEVSLPWESRQQAEVAVFCPLASASETSSERGSCRRHQATGVAMLSRVESPERSSLRKR